MSSAYWYCPSAYIRKSRFLIVERQLGYDERGRTSGRALERVIYKFLADELLRDDSPFPAEHILCARDLGREAAISAGVFLLADDRRVGGSIAFVFFHYIISRLSSNLNQYSCNVIVSRLSYILYHNAAQKSIVGAN